MSSRLAKDLWKTLQLDGLILSGGNTLANYANKKDNLTEYLIKASKEINRRLDKPKELTPVQRDMIEGWIDKIYKKAKSGDNRYFGEDYDAIRTAFTKAMLHGVAEFNGNLYTTRKIREYYDIV